MHLPLASDTDLACIYTGADPGFIMGVRALCAREKKALGWFPDPFLMCAPNNLFNARAHTQGTRVGLVSVRARITRPRFDVMW